MKSHILDREVTVGRRRACVTTADGVTYTRDELSLLKGVHPEMIAVIHTAKRVFRGQVVGRHNGNGA